MAAEYQLIQTPAAGVIRASDGKWIHESPDIPNPEWSDYQEWLKAGNVPDPAYTPPEGATGATGATGTAHAAGAAAPGAKGPRTHG